MNRKKQKLIEIFLITFFFHFYYIISTSIFCYSNTFSGKLNNKFTLQK